MQKIIPLYIVGIPRLNKCLARIGSIITKWAQFKPGENAASINLAEFIKEQYVTFDLMLCCLISDGRIDDL